MGVNYEQNTKRPKLSCHFWGAESKSKSREQRSDRQRPEELWTEVRDIVQEAGIKTIPRERKHKKAKWLSEKALQIGVRRREAKGKEEKEKYTHLNAEFQRIARRDKRAFLSDQCKEIEENNRLGKTSNLFKRIRDTKVQRWAQ